MKKQTLLLVVFIFQLYTANLFCQAEQIVPVDQVTQSSTSATKKIEADVKPKFPGCEDQGLSEKEAKNCRGNLLLRYVYMNLKYPKKARKEKIEGMVVIVWTIDSKGKMKDIKIEREIGGGCGDAAMDVFYKMQKEVTWIPAMKDNQPIDFEYKMPVKFKLEG